MPSFYKKLRTNKIVLFLASLRIAVLGLFLLFILTFWGTVAQVHNGLYASQERYFSSFYFLAMGFLPFPGGQLVLWILFVNLFFAFFTRIIYSGEKIGLIIVHIGLMLFLITAFVTMHVAKESHLTLQEGQSANVSQSYGNWEVAVWKESFLSSHRTSKTILALDVDDIKPGEFLLFQAKDQEVDISFTVRTYYPNAQAFFAPPNEPHRPFAKTNKKYLNSSGINIIEERPAEKERERNIAAIILDMEGQLPILLYGTEDNPTKIHVQDKNYFVILRHQRYPLPVTVKLIDFMMDKHPGTQIARSFKSKVAIEHDGIRRETVISMNEPLRYKDYTFYQASYQIDATGREASTLAVVRNGGRLLPYIATFVTFFGLAFHFLISAFKFQRSRK